MSFLFRSSRGRPRPRRPDPAAPGALQAQHFAGRRIAQLGDPPRGSHPGKKSVRGLGSLASPIATDAVSPAVFPPADYPDAQRVPEPNGPK